MICEDPTIKGLSVYKSKAGFTCVRVHYSADPARDPDTPEGMAWVADASRGLVGGVTSSDWRMENEIDWEVTGGQAVFPMIQLFRSRIVIPPITLPDGCEFYASYDYGHRNPSAFHVHAVDCEGKFYTIWEYYQATARYRDQARAIRKCEYFDRLSCMPIADPSIWDLTQQTENEVKSIAQLFAELPDDERIDFMPGKHGGDVTFAEKVLGDLWRPLVIEFNIASGTAGADTKVEGEVKWQIFETCPNLIRELGGLRWAEWSGTAAAQRNVKEKIVDRNNHAFDGAKMFMNMFFSLPVRPSGEEFPHLKGDPVSRDHWIAMKERDNAGQSGLGDWG